MQKNSEDEHVVENSLHLSTRPTQNQAQRTESERTESERQKSEESEEVEKKLQQTCRRE